MLSRFSHRFVKLTSIGNGLSYIWSLLSSHRLVPVKIIITLVQMCICLSVLLIIPSAKFSVSKFDSYLWDFCIVFWNSSWNRCKSMNVSLTDLRSGLGKLWFSNRSWSYLTPQICHRPPTFCRGYSTYTILSSILVSETVLKA